MDGDGPAGGESPYYKVGCRYYDPDAGRFITRDTDLSQPPYAYYGGDPVNFTDPNGHSKFSKWWQTLIASIAAAITMGTGVATHQSGGSMEENPEPTSASQHLGSPSGSGKGKGDGDTDTFSFGDGLAGGAIGAGIGYGAWEIFKWGTATLAAPETGGLRYVLAGVTP